MNTLAEDLKELEAGGGDVAAFRAKYMIENPAGMENGFRPYVAFKDAPREALQRMAGGSAQAMAGPPLSMSALKLGGAEDGLLGAANDFWRKRRLNRLKKRIGKAKQLVACEGDSWFHYPFGFDCMTHFEDTAGVALSTAAAAGDTLANMSRNGWASLRATLKVGERTADVLLFSGGGNDILFGKDGDRFEDMIQKGQAGKPDTWITPAFHTGLKAAADQIRDMIAAVRDEHPKLPIVLHGYDVPMVRKKGNSMASKFAEVGLLNTPADIQMREAIVRVMIEALYKALREIEGDNQRVMVANILDRITRNEDNWFDEIHPEGPGWGLAYDRLFVAVRHFIPEFPHRNGPEV